MQQPSKDRKLRAGWTITFLASIGFMAFSVIDASTHYWEKNNMLEKPTVVCRSQIRK